MDNLHFEKGVIKEAIDPKKLSAFVAQLPRWHVVQGHPEILAGEFAFDNFVDALQFANQVGELAEQYDHHPEVTVEYGKTSVRWWTHTAHGITTNDIIMAIETDRLFDS
jgi:4a-hydroxytetrahydrobiopterin dehydratase